MVPRLRSGSYSQDVDIRRKCIRDGYFWIRIEVKVAMKVDHKARC
jgi:hypothetical protein